MSHSSQFENVRELLYTETRQMLEERDLGDNDMNVVHLEQVQSWILVAFYEFLRCSYRRAWFSAGRVFRLVQLLRLHEVDGPAKTITQLLMGTTDEQIVAEEKRRAFWVAYCLDRFISVNNGLPLTLNEEVVSNAPTIEAPPHTPHSTKHASSIDLHPSPLPRTRICNRPIYTSLLLIRSHRIQRLQLILTPSRVRHHRHSLRPGPIPL